MGRRGDRGNMVHLRKSHNVQFAWSLDYNVLDKKKTGGKGKQGQDYTL